MDCDITYRMYVENVWTELRRLRYPLEQHRQDLQYDIERSCYMVRLESGIFENVSTYSVYFASTRTYSE